MFVCTLITFFLYSILKVLFQSTMAVHVVTVIHRPQGVEEEAGGKREPGGVQGDHQE
jgi:hypothetical protein